VDLPDQFAVAREVDVSPLQQDLEVGRPPLLALVCEWLRDNL